MEKSKNRLEEPTEAAKVLKTVLPSVLSGSILKCKCRKRHVKMTLQNIDFLTSQIKKIDVVIEHELMAIPQTLDTIPGIGPALTSVTVAEIREVSRFKNHAALAQYSLVKDHASLFPKLPS